MPADAPRGRTRAVAAGTATRAYGVAVAAAGTGTAVAAASLARRTASRTGARPAVGVVRVLGARQVIQGAAVVTAPTPVVVALGVAVDALHATSMFGLAGAMARYRRPALISGALASVSALCGGLLLWRQVSAVAD